MSKFLIFLPFIKIIALFVFAFGNDSDGEEYSPDVDQSFDQKNADQYSDQSIDKTTRLSESDESPDQFVKSKF